jgi:hypothetical protein
MQLIEFWFISHKHYKWPKMPMWCTFWRFNSLSNGCPLHQNERDCLFRNLRETHKNIETLLFGNDEININENSIIFNKVRAYIRQNILIYGRSSGLHQYQFISHVSLYCVKYCLYVCMRYFCLHYYMCIVCRERTVHKFFHFKHILFINKWNGLDSRQ